MPRVAGVSGQCTLTTSACVHIARKSDRGVGGQDDASVAQRRRQRLHAVPHDERDVSRKPRAKEIEDLEPARAAEDDLHVGGRYLISIGLLRLSSAVTTAPPAPFTGVR